MTYTSTWCGNCGHAHGWACVGWAEPDRPEQWCPECDCYDWVEETT